MYPKKIKVPSDDTELEFTRIEIAPKTKEESVIYRYTKAFCFLGSEIKFTKAQFEKSVKNERFISMT